MNILSLNQMYGLAVKIRNIAYEKGILQTKRLPVPVISVGNISLGGSGKTPTVKFIADKVLAHKKVCILLRGYKRKSKGTLIVSEYGKLKINIFEAGDEAYMLAKLLPNASVIVSEDRYEGGLKAIKELGSEIIILDDGFQHRKLFRDIDIVLLRKKDLKDRLIPLGRLREPLFSVERADAIILSYQESEPFSIETDKPVFKMYRRFRKVYTCDLTELPIDSNILDKEFICVSALADNSQFLKTLQGLGFKIKKCIFFRDHYDYSNFHVDKREIYITTLKDMFKIGKYANIFAIGLDIDILGLDKFIEAKLP